MATKLSNLLPLILSFIFLFQNGCLARNSNQQSPNVCMMQNLNPLEPTYTLRAEAGQTEFWENNNQQFQCAGVELKRHTIEQRGLFLPVYATLPQMLYVEQGRGMFGILVPGCPETYQSSQGSQQHEYQEQERGQVFGDRHQKVGQLIQGDVITVPAGSAHWIYNEGNEELVIVALADTSNNANQLDNNDRVRNSSKQYPTSVSNKNHKTFFIAGNPQSSSQGQRYQRRDSSRERQSQRHQGYDPRRERQSERHQAQMSPRRGVQQYNSGNIFSGFDIEVLIEAFGIDERTARKLQGQEDERGHIIRAEQGLQVIRPPVVQGREERQRQHQRLDMPANGIEETICTRRVASA
ncbi:hypothetical protein Leryth_027608 [Lithospermum erythrorhizon]|nr:hypothetical protein Leryth_027608 [Lithospermum erythrorhizon]